MKRTYSEYANERGPASAGTSDGKRARSPTNARSDPVTSLHQALGNRAVHRLHRNADGRAELDVSQPDDETERQAERVTEAVMRTPVSEPESDPLDGIHGRATAGGRPTDEGATKRRIGSLGGGSKPLSPSVRSFFEPRFGQDFGDVRVHTGPGADEAARSIDAEAFTTGRDVVFARGKYAPGTSEGRELIAHELAHVVQQRTGQSTPLVQRNDDGDGDSNLLTDDDIVEAIRWHNARFARYGFEYVEWLQTLAGMTDPGWGDLQTRREFVRTIAEFQDRTGGLAVDGMVGPRTLRELWNQYYVVPNWDVAIRVIVLAFGMPTRGLKNGLESLSYDPDLESSGRTTGKPGAAEVRIGPNAFESSFPALANTIRHELQHAQQARRGVADEALREFRAEAQELLSELRGAPRMRQRFPEQMADAKRALKYWNELDEAQKIQERELFARLKDEVTTIFRRHLGDPRWTFYMDILREYLTTRVPPPP